MVQEEYKVTITLRNRITTFNIYMIKRERKAKKRDGESMTKEEETQERMVIQNP